MRDVQGGGDCDDLEAVVTSKAARTPTLEAATQGSCLTAGLTRKGRFIAGSPKYGERRHVRSLLGLEGVVQVVWKEFE